MNVNSKLSKAVLIYRLRGWFVPAFVGLSLVSIMIVFTLNVPIRSEVISARVLRSLLAPSPDQGDLPMAFVELESGRTVAIGIPIGRLLPADNETVAVRRLINRFFGDHFALAQ